MDIYRLGVYGLDRPLLRNSNLDFVTKLLKRLIPNDSIIDSNSPAKENWIFADQEYGFALDLSREFFSFVLKQKA